MYFFAMSIILDYVKHYLCNNLRSLFDQKQMLHLSVCRTQQGSPLMREFSASWHLVLVFQNKRDLNKLLLN